MNQIIVVGILGGTAFILLLLSVYALSNDVELISWIRTQLDPFFGHKQDTTGYAEERYSSHD